MKQTIRLNERELKHLIREAVKEVRRKKEPKRGTIEWKDGKRIDAVEDGVDKYGNPMYRVKDGSAGGRKCKDGSCRVQAFDFLPYGATDKEFPLNENKLRRSIRESVKRVLNEIYSNGREMTLEDFIEERHQEYIRRGGPDWYWDDEGIVYAVQDYYGSQGEFSEEDWETLKNMGLEEVGAMCEDEEAVKKANESELHRIIRESVKSVLSETRLDYDIDNFSGRWYKNPPEDYIDPEGSLDNPNGGDPFGEYRDEIVADYDGDEKAAENDYSWDLNQSVYPSIYPYSKINRNGVNREIDDIQRFRNRGKEWLPQQLRSADRMKDKWIKGERDLDDIEDEFYDSSVNESVNRAIRKYLK